MYIYITLIFLFQTWKKGDNNNGSCNEFYFLNHKKVIRNSCETLNDKMLNLSTVDLVAIKQMSLEYAWWKHYLSVFKDAMSILLSAASIINNMAYIWFN